ncbi:hypothetical protein IJS77_02425 [bacterium]|nr:hypothetical protein [bacterium]
MAITSNFDLLKSKGIEDIQEGRKNLTQVIVNGWNNNIIINPETGKTTVGETPCDAGQDAETNCSQPVTNDYETNNEQIYKQKLMALFMQFVMQMMQSLGLNQIQNKDGETENAENTIKPADGIQKSLAADGSKINDLIPWLNDIYA